MFKKLKIGCDKDNVLARYAERFCDILEEKYGIPLPVGEISHYRFDENHTQIHRIMVTEILTKIIVGEEQRNMLPIKEGIDCLNSIKDNIELWIITSTLNYGSEQEDIEIWCKKNNLDCKVIISAAKEDWVKDLQLDFMIEDRGDTALKIAKTCPSCRVLLLNRPWNRFVDTKSLDNLQRCNDWYEIDRILRKQILSR